MNLSLDDLAHAIEHSDAIAYYVDAKEGRVVEVEAGVGDAAAFEHAMHMEEDFERYIPLSNFYDSEELRAMRAFAEAQAPAMRERLTAVLEGAGAAPRFRKQVRRMLLEARWKAFLHAHFRDVARAFCEENALAYEE